MFSCRLAYLWNRSISLSLLPFTSITLAPDGTFTFTTFLICCYGVLVLEIRVQGPTRTLLPFGEQASVLRSSEWPMTAARVISDLRGCDYHRCKSVLGYCIL